ncbi:hypothetical protein D3C86_1062520 [compost metagenome]
MRQAAPIKLGVALGKGLAQAGTGRLVEWAVGQVDRNLMPLAAVAHEHHTLVRQGRIRRGAAHHGVDAVGQFVKQALDGGVVDAIQALVKTPNGLIGDGRPQEAHRGTHTGGFRDDDALDAQLARQRGSVQRRRAAKGDQRVFLGRLAQFRRMHARGIGHVLGHDIDDGLRGLRGIEAGGLRQMRLNGALGQRRIEADLAYGEALGRYGADQGVRVGHRGQFTAVTVSRRTGQRARAVRPDLHDAQMVDAGDGSTSGADFHHLDHGYADRQAGSFQVSVHTTEFKAAADLGFKIIDVADLGRGAAHVERQRARSPRLLGDVLRQDGAARRSGFDQPHGFFHPGLERGDGPARGHQKGFVA